VWKDNLRVNAKIPAHKIVSFFSCEYKTWSHYQGGAGIDGALKLGVKKHYCFARDKLRMNDCVICALFQAQSGQPSRIGSPFFC
jgi:hypothetical protein